MSTASGRPAVLEHLPWRVAGLVLLGALVVVYHPEQGGAVNRLIIPLGMGIATWMLVQNLAAVSLGAGILAGIHSAPGSADWVRGIAYPIVTVACAIALGAVLLARFRRQIAATHEARWQQRQERRQSQRRERRQSQRRERRQSQRRERRQSQRRERRQSQRREREDGGPP